MYARLLEQIREYRLPRRGVATALRVLAHGTLSVVSRSHDVRPFDGLGHRLDLLGLEMVLCVLQKCLLHHRLDVLGHRFALLVLRKSVLGLKNDTFALEKSDCGHQPDALEPRVVL